MNNDKFICCLLNIYEVNTEPKNDDVRARCVLLPAKKIYNGHSVIRNGSRIFCKIGPFSLAVHAPLLLIAGCWICKVPLIHHQQNLT